MADFYYDGIFSAADAPLDGVLWREGDVVPDPDPSTCVYTHFNLTTEQLGQTKRYNCWGFTFLARRFWISRSDVDTILHDNCLPVADGSVEVGDVIRYQLNGQTTHTGRVWQTDGAGHAVKIRSKWGPTGEYIHAPLDCSFYGTDLAYFRQVAPLRGDPAEEGKVGDLWIMDSPGDDGEQASSAPWWTSPDILVDAYPFDGVPDANPAFDHPNRVWAVVRNRINQRVPSFYVRYYWADPAAGLAPKDWHLIPGAPGHPNPVGPLAVNGSASIEAPYVEWTPAAAPAHQCLLAIAYVSDDPQDRTNPNPLVYPFDVVWDNNVAQRNVEVKHLNAWSSAEFAIAIHSPWQGEFTGSIYALLSRIPRDPAFPAPRTLPDVTIALDRRRPVRLEPIRRSRLLRDRRFRLSEREEMVAGVTLSRVSLVSGKRHLLNGHLTVPGDAWPGEIYSLHLVQVINDQVTGGYSIFVEVV